MDVYSITKDFHELAKQFQKLPENGKNDFYKFAKQLMTDEEYKAFCVCFGYMDLLMNPDKNDAMMRSLAEQMYQEFNKK